MSDRHLLPWAEEAAFRFYEDYGSGNCVCFLGCAPCSSCTHPGNPVNLEEDPHAWGTLIDVMAEEAKARVAHAVEVEYRYQLLNMAVFAKLHPDARHLWLLQESNSAAFRKNFRACFHVGIANAAQAGGRAP